MIKEEAISKLTHALRRAHMSEKTVESYCGWIGRFYEWWKNLRPSGRQSMDTNEDRVTGFLSCIAPKVTVSTQKQALCALVYFHREVIGKPIGELPDWVSAARPRRLPQWVNAREAQALFERMKGMPRLLAELMFGSGLRLNEALTLRVKDLDFDRLLVSVRQGKGNKDRVTIMPASLAEDLRGAVERSRMLFEDDRVAGRPGVYLPPAVGRKFPKAGERWPWQWLFPSHKLAADPVTGIVRRHHLHDATLNKAILTASGAARIEKRITSHALRHGFATEMLLSGMPIHELRELMGHASIETTSIYLHCLPRLQERAVSPLDSLRKVTPMRRLEERENVTRFRVSA